MSLPMFPLRGFLRCSKCTRMLCNSASKGPNSHYSYYHCSSACDYRKKAEEVNEAFIMELQEFVLNPESAEFFKKAIMDAYIDAAKGDTKNRTDYIVEITELHHRITKARELLLMGDLDGVDYKRRSSRKAKTGSLCLNQNRLKFLSEWSTRRRWRACWTFYFSLSIRLTVCY